jgi:hypothetical protein
MATARAVQRLLRLHPVAGENVAAGVGVRIGPGQRRFGVFPQSRLDQVVLEQLIVIPAIGDRARRHVDTGALGIDGVTVVFLLEVPPDILH